MAIIIQTQPICLTPAAAEILKGLRRQQKLDEGYALRLYIAGKTCSGFQYGIAFDNISHETDTTFQSEGFKILVDENSIKYIGGATVDFIDDERGKGFLVDNPSMKPSCSCESGHCGTSRE